MNYYLINPRALNHQHLVSFPLNVKWQFKPDIMNSLRMSIVYYCHGVSLSLSICQFLSSSLFSYFPYFYVLYFQPRPDCRGHGSYIRWLHRARCARVEKMILSSRVLSISNKCLIRIKLPIQCAPISEVPSNIITMVETLKSYCARSELFPVTFLFNCPNHGLRWLLRNRCALGNF